MNVNLSISLFYINLNLDSCIDIIIRITDVSSEKQEGDFKQNLLLGASVQKMVNKIQEYFDKIVKNNIVKTSEG